MPNYLAILLIITVAATTTVICELAFHYGKSDSHNSIVHLCETTPDKSILSLLECSKYLGE